jgi:hypothetical protein
MSVKTHTRPEGPETERDQTALRPLPGCRKRWRSTSAIGQSSEEKTCGWMRSSARSPLVAAADRSSGLDQDIVDAVWEARRAAACDQVLELGRSRAMKRVVENLCRTSGNHRV